MKKIVQVAALSASMLAFGASANAAVLEMNIYGASAQLNFWNSYAPIFLKKTVAEGGMGCATTTSGFLATDGNLGVTRGFTCAGNGGEDVILGYTANKSVEGPIAVENLQSGAGVDSCAAVGGVYPNRRVATMSATGAITAACKDIHVGASDVASESFTQASQGMEKGYLGTGASINEDLSAKFIPGSDDIATTRRPIIVPFSFFANKNLPVDNITRQQALLLFSGNVANWSKFGPGYPDAEVALCMRHAGSGTHATLDKAIMRGDRDLATGEWVFGPGVAATMFHESSSDLAKCINANGAPMANSAGGTYVAIGYADSDKMLSALNADGSEVNGSSYTNVKRLKYNGVGEGMTPANYAAYGYSALKNEIIHGIYEFWSAQYMYMNAENPAVTDMFDKMMTFAETNTLPCDPATNQKLGCYWLNSTELQVTKDLDTTVPYFSN